MEGEEEVTEKVHLKSTSCLARPELSGRRTASFLAGGLGGI